MTGVSLDTLRRWERIGRLSVVRTAGGHRRYREDDVRSLVQTREEESPEDAAVGKIIAVLPSQSDQRMLLWNEAQRYILKATTTQVPWEVDNPVYHVLSRDAVSEPIFFSWDSRTSDECARLCESRVRLRLIPGVTMRDLAVVVWQSIREYCENETDRRIQAENLALGLDGQSE